METVTVDRLNVIISATKAEFDKKINEVTHQLDDMNDKIDKVGENSLGVFRNLASGLKALGIGAMIKSAINLAGDLEQNIGGSESVFKDYAAVVQQTASTAASSLGLSESKYLATANKMGALFQGSGFSIAKSADMTTRAMQRASDVASIMGIEVDSAMEAVAGMAKGNFTMMDNLGVAINDTNLQLYAQEKGLGKLETTQQKVNAAMQMFIDKTDYAAGNYARENDTYSGALTTLKAEFENFAAEAGTALLPLAQSVLPIASQLLNELKPAIVIVAEAISSLGSVVTDISEKVNNAEPGTKTALKIAVGMAVAIPAVSVATKALAAAKALYSGVLSILIPKQLTFASALKATMGWIGIIIGALALIGLASESGADSIGNSAENLEKENEAAQGAADGIGKVADSTDNLTDSVSRATAGFDEINKLGGSSSTFASSIVSKDDVDNAEDFAATVDEIKSGIDGLNTDLDFTANFGLSLSDMWGQISSGELGKTLIHALVGAFTGETDTTIIDDAITNWLNDVIDGNFVNWFKNWNSGKQQLIDAAKKNIKNALKSLGADNETTDALVDFWGDFVEHNDEALRSAWGTGWESLCNTYRNGITSMLTSITNDGIISKAVADFWYDCVTANVNAVVKAWDSGMTQVFGDLWKNYKNWAYVPNETTEQSLNLETGPFDPTTIIKPRTYAAGGFPDYGDIFVANERGPEMVGSIGGRTAVVNNSQIETAIENAVARGMSRAGGNGQPIEIHVYTELDGEVIGESVTEYQSNQTRRDNGYKK